MGKPKLPWKRGPAAWKIASHSEEIKTRLHAQPRHFLSLRRTAKIFGVSTQPIRDWIRLGHLKREGPRRQIALDELERFIGWLDRRAEPFLDENYTRRFIRKTGEHPSPFQTLKHAQFIWPKGQNTLTPRKLAELIGCHPSLITKAIYAHRCMRLGRWNSHSRRKITRDSWPSDGTSYRCGWEISRSAWQNVFPTSIISKPSVPPLPQTMLFSTREAADHLCAWGVGEVSAYDVRRMIHDGQLEAIRPTLGKRKLFVTRKSLVKFRIKALDSLSSPEFRP
jgi:hypothetical protein